MLRSLLSKPRDRLAEGDGHQRGFAGAQRAVGDHDGGGRTQTVDRVVVGIGGAAAGVAGQVADAGVVQGDQVGRVVDAGTVGVNVAVQVTPPSLLLTAVNVPLAIVRSALVKPVTASQKVMVTSEVSPSAQRGVRDHDGRGRAHRIDGVVVGIGGAAAGVAGQVGHAGVVQRDEVGRVVDARGRRKRRGPGDAAVAAAHRGQRAVGNGQVGVGETADRFAEGDGHQRGFADRSARCPRPRWWPSDARCRWRSCWNRWCRCRRCPRRFAHRCCPG